MNHIFNQIHWKYGQVQAWKLLYAWVCCRKSPSNIRTRSDLAILSHFEKAERKPCDLYRHGSASLWAWLLVHGRLLTGFGSDSIYFPDWNHWWVTQLKLRIFQFLQVKTTDMLIGFSVVGLAKNTLWVMNPMSISFFSPAEVGRFSILIM